MFVAEASHDYDAYRIEVDMGKGKENDMELRLLLEVENHFQLTGRGLVVAPVLDMPSDNRIIHPFSADILICRPDGSEEHLEGYFNSEHFLLYDGSSMWKIVLIFPTASKDSIPIHSKIFVSADTAMKLSEEA